MIWWWLAFAAVVWWLAGRLADAFEDLGVPSGTFDDQVRSKRGG